MTTTQTTEPIYQVSQVKIHYGHPDDVTSVEEVPASQLYRELDARGVQSRLFTYEDGTSQTVNGEFTQWKLVRRGGAAGQWTPTPFQVPARELAVDDVISMGKISHVDLKDTYVALRFYATYGEHGTAFPLDLEVTVLSRRPVEAEVDLVAELTALADRWDRSGTRRKADAANHRVPQYEVGGMIAEANQLRHCATMLRELLARVTA